MGNNTNVINILLLGFPIGVDLQLLFFFIVLSIYILTLIANITIITLVKLNQHLQTPMYLLLSHLSIVDIFYSSTIVPKMLFTLLQKNSISLAGCFTQQYFYVSLGTTEFFLLGVMAVDRYFAICNPLRYAAIMNEKICLQATSASWLVAFLSMLFVVIFLSKLLYCGPFIVDHFFCDLAPLLKLSCIDPHMMENVVLIFCCCAILPSFLITIVSYTFIVFTILRTPSQKGRKEAFSTCASHFMVVVILYGTVIFIYVRPAHGRSIEINKFIGVFNTVVTPLLNPLIYCLRNKDVKMAMRKQFSRNLLRNNLPQ
ncbi:olfactory receptor 6M1-like [Pleurodeles waltl]|uniref:olfactory receptor 6M1-like n=1 Tax=Pleurodeles waltl TaxID=8319 RepID=UPI003709C1DB